jgi:ACS family hexuronate transporter-like MFS transporter
MNLLATIQLAETADQKPDVISAPSFAASLRAGERRLRWFIVGWMTLSTILNLIDRQTLSILAPTLMKEFHLTNSDYSTIVNGFLLAYTVMYTVGGWFVDRVGEKIGMTVCILWWSIATMLHSTVTGGLGLRIFRFLLGIGEPGNYPAALRASARWFAKEERGLPIAIWSSGSSVGSLIAPPLLAFITLHFGWRMTFFVPGFLGAIWVLVWVLVYRQPSVSLESLAPANRTSVCPPADSPKPKPAGLLELLKDGRVRAIVLARLVSDPVWVFYLYWTPKYLSDAWGYDLKKIGLYAWIPFVFGGLGGVFGGMASDWLVRRGLKPAQARKRLLYIAGAVAPLGMTIGFANSSAVAIALIALMAFVVYVWFIDTAALISDVFPEHSVGSILGLMGTAGSLGGIGLNWLAGHVLDHYHTYTPVFVVAGSGHLIASMILFAFLKDKPAKQDETT